MMSQDPDRDPTVVRRAARPDDPDATVRKPLWAFWRGATKPAAAGRDATTVLVPRADTPEADPADDAALPADRTNDKNDDSDATVIRNTVVRTAEATQVDADRTLQRGTTLRPLPKRSLALPKGLQLHEYRIERVLGQGGFGITYLATDINLDAKVAIKEYLPEEIAFRANDRSVSPNASEHRDRYQQGLNNFLTEARTLASFRHPNIVRVARFFEAHTTAYMVLEYERGRSFKKWWARQQQDTETGQTAAHGERLLVQRLQPLLDGLSAVHRSGYLHRDIKPDNIQVRAQDGRFVLLDFGSAGQTVALADQDAVVVTPGYAPIEQYGLGEQGAWTDLYALGATLYWAVAGRKPPDAETRALGISMPAAVDVGKGRFGRAFLEAIDWALQMDAAQRPQTVDAWRQRLLADHVNSPGRQDLLDDDEDLVPDEGTVSGRSAWQSAWRARLQSKTRRLQPAAWPLGRQLALALVVMALLPLLLASLLLLSSLRDATLQAQLQQAEAAALASAQRVSRLAVSATRVARSVAADAELVPWLSATSVAGGEALEQRLKTLHRAHPDLEWLLVTDSTGTVRLSTVPNRLGQAWHQPDGGSGARATSPGPASSSTQLVAATAGTGLLISEPVRDVAGKPAGWVVLRLSGTALAAALTPLRADEGWTPMLVDEDGLVVHHPQTDQQFRSLLPLPPTAAQRAAQRYQRSDFKPHPATELAAVLQGQRVPGQLNWQASTGSQQLSGFAPVPGQRWMVFMSRAGQTLPPALKRLGLLLGLGGLVAAAVAVWLAFRLVRRVVQPVQALTAAAGALRAGQFDQAYVDVQGRDELAQLARSFNVTVDALRQRERERASRR